MKCPSCFRGIPPTVEKLACQSCEPMSPTEVTNEFGHDLAVRPIFDAVLGRCPRCSTPSSAEACPWCWSVIPPEWRRQPPPKVTCIAMAGARTTGKSMYLGVLKHQLDLFLIGHGSLLRSVGDTERMYTERYGEAIFKERRRLGSTLPAQQDQTTARPLIFEFREPEGATHLLVLRDVAGEDLENVAERAQQLRFLSRADAIVLLLDPLKIDEVRRVLQGEVQQGELGGDGVQLLSNLLDHIKRTSETARCEVPIAVTLSKVDILQKLSNSPSDLRRFMRRPGSPLQRDPSMTRPRYDSKDGGLLHAEIDSLLSNLMGQRLRNVLREGADTYHYFAVSTLGDDTEGDAIDAAGIAPYRILDPVKWILSLESTDVS
jgi:hypothetical protein